MAMVPLPFLDPADIPLDAAAATLIAMSLYALAQVQFSLAGSMREPAREKRPPSVALGD